MQGVVLAAALSLAAFFADQNKIMVVPGNNVIEGNIEDEVENFAAGRKGRAFCKKKRPMPKASAFLSKIKQN